MELHAPAHRLLLELSRGYERSSGSAGPPSIREFKQITTAGATTAAVTKKVWGEYVSVIC